MQSEVAEEQMSEFDEKPEDWSDVSIEEIVDINMGQSPPGESYNEEGNGAPFMQGNAQFGSKYPQDHRFTTDPKSGVAVLLGDG